MIMQKTTEIISTKNIIMIMKNTTTIMLMKHLPKNRMMYRKKHPLKAILTQDALMHRKSGKL